MVPNIANRPQNISALTVRKEYEIGRPQSPFVVQPPQPVGIDNELYEEVLGDRQFIDYDDGTETGRITLLSRSSVSTQLMAAEEVLGVRDQVVHEETTDVIGNMVERGGA